MQCNFFKISFSASFFRFERNSKFIKYNVIFFLFEYSYPNYIMTMIFWICFKNVINCLDLKVITILRFLSLFVILFHAVHIFYKKIILLTQYNMNRL